MQLTSYRMLSSFTYAIIWHRTVCHSYNNTIYTACVPLSMTNAPPVLGKGEIPADTVAERRGLAGYDSCGEDVGLNAASSGSSIDVSTLSMWMNSK